MNAPFDSPRPQTVTALPIEFQALCPPPQLLPGESLDHYHALQAAIFGTSLPNQPSNGSSPSISPNYPGRCSAIACCDTAF